MADWPYFPSSPKVVTITGDETWITGTSLTPGSYNTEGSWVELTASTSYDFEALIVSITTPDDGRKFMVDIGIGNSGNEKIIIENLHWYMTTISSTAIYSLSEWIYLPIHIPKGSRIVARAQSSGPSSNKCYLMAYGIPTNWYSLISGSKIISIGDDLSSTRGTGIILLASNTKSPWVELSSSLPEDIRAFYVYVHIDIYSGSSDIQNIALDVGIGPSGSETAIVENCFFAFYYGTSTIYQKSTHSELYEIFIPKGERLSVRAQGTNARTCYVILYGVV